MTKFFRIIGVFAIVLALSGCRVSRDSADQKLAKACEAAINVLLSSDEELSVNKTSFSYEELSSGLKLRAVKLEGDLVVHRGRERTREYRCTFGEEFGPFGFGHNASYYGLEKDGAFYGYKDGKMIGDLNDHLRLTEAVDGILKK